MSDASAILALPYLQPAQAQKHVTHNEALRRLDVLVQTAVADRDLGTPPANPTEGARYIVGPAAAAAWAGHAGEIAVFLNGTWEFLTPQPGWQTHVLDEATTLVWSGADWTAPLASLPLLGINTTADATNRLAVAAPATLLTHEGAGHQLKVNKASLSDTGSLLFQTGFSGRAEMGLAGSDDFAIKVSATGGAFVTALTAAAADGRITLPVGLRLGAGNAALPGLAFDGDPDTGLSGPGANQIGLSTGGVQRALMTTTNLQVNVPITGTAVQSSATDTTPGRLLGVGAFGLGGTGSSLEPTNLDDTAWPVGFFRATTGLATGTFPPGIPAGVGAYLRVERFDAAHLSQTMWRSLGDGHGTWRRICIAGTWQPWRQIAPRSLLGAVTQSAGIPTGALIESGTNANGEFARFADGTQICRRTLTASATADTNWTFPAVFVTATDLLVSASAATSSNAVFAQCRVPTDTAVGFNVWTTAGARQALVARLIAIGRWF